MNKVRARSLTEISIGADAAGSPPLRNRKDLAAGRDLRKVVHEAEVVVAGSADGPVPTVHVQDVQPVVASVPLHGTELQVFVTATATPAATCVKRAKSAIIAAVFRIVPFSIARTLPDKPLSGLRNLWLSVTS